MVPLMTGVPAAAAGTVRLVALGDSLTAGYRLPADAAFPTVLERLLKAKGMDVTVANAGVSGDTATGGLDRVDWSVPDGTDGVILELGANDMLRGTDPTVTEGALAGDHRAAEGARASRSCSPACRPRPISGRTTRRGSTRSTRRSPSATTSALPVLPRRDHRRPGAAPRRRDPPEPAGRRDDRCPHPADGARPSSPACARRRRADAAPVHRARRAAGDRRRAEGLPGRPAGRPLDRARRLPRDPALHRRRRGGDGRRRGRGAVRDAAAPCPDGDASPVSASSAATSPGRSTRRCGRSRA